MKNSPLANIKLKVLQRGVAAVEFALIAIPFLLLLLGAMELGRLLYLWNTAQEVTRNAARQAVVTNFNDANAIAAIKRAAIFRVTDGTLPASSEVSNVNVIVRYLNSNLDLAAPMPTNPAANIMVCDLDLDSESCIRYVEVCLSTGSTCAPGEMVSFVPMVGLFASTNGGINLTGIGIPLSTVRMPAESLGFVPASPPTSP